MRLIDLVSILTNMFLPWTASTWSRLKNQFVLAWMMNKQKNAIMLSSLKKWIWPTFMHCVQAQNLQGRMRKVHLVHDLKFLFSLQKVAAASGDIRRAFDICRYMVRLFMMHIVCFNVYLWFALLSIFCHDRLGSNLISEHKINSSALLLCFLVCYPL